MGLVGPLQESNRSFSANDLSKPNSPDLLLGDDGDVPWNSSDNSKRIQPAKLKRSPSDGMGSTDVDQDAATLKRSAPGLPSGYYSQRFYHSLPHHYKLPFGNSHIIKEKTAFPSEYSRKLAVVMKWFKEFNNEQKNQVLYFTHNNWNIQLLMDCGF